MPDNELTILQHERKDLLERIQQLETELSNLRQRLSSIDANIKATKATMTRLSLEEKVRLFRSLFRGREDVFARRWQSRTTGKSGYQPVCANEWRLELCDKRKYKCAECPNRQLLPLTDADVYRHLEGRSVDCTDVIGFYVVNEDNTCHLLCADFDDKNCDHGFKGDVRAFTSVCRDWGVPYAVERSRSGNGAHVWIFFETPISAQKVRQLGNAILTEAMTRDKCLSFKSYDRFFPNQDQLPIGGFGNLVALPLQGQVRKRGNSVFVNEDFEPYPDQWEFLLNVKRMSTDAVEDILHRNANTPALGNLSTTSEQKPWETPVAPVISTDDFTGSLTIVKADMLYIPMQNVSAKVVNHLKRIASFKNPEFYSKQGMRLPTYNVPRIISCAEIIDDYLALPRGCEEAVTTFLQEKGVDFTIEDKTNKGTTISVDFVGSLRDEQAEAIQSLATHRNGVLYATTAFGKTVTAIGLIAQLKVNTLILVHTKALLDQWKSKLEEFLTIDHTPDEEPRKRGRRRKWSPVGTLSSACDTRHGIIDIALLQSCVSDNEVKPFVKDYGMVIVDECHHVTAVNYERVLRAVTAERVYGFTATPIRKNGHQPIMFMQCGPIRYTADTEAQMSTQTFSRTLVPRFTGFRSSDDNPTYTNAIQQLAEDEYRNRMIVDDVLAALREGRSPIVLTSLTIHVATLVELLQPHCPNVITLIGSASQKEKRLKMEQLQCVAPDKPLVIVATGKYIGEGFDCPRLDTMFLALPVSWKGIIAQYAGRLHRDYEGKEEVRIYDYIDINVPVCDTMYRRRLKGYANVGYSLQPTGVFAEVKDADNLIYNGKTFLTPFLRNLAAVKRSIVIASPRVNPGRHSQIVAHLLDLVTQGIRITIYTRTANEHTEHLSRHGAKIVIKENLTLTCTILDNTRLWYGNVSPLTYQSETENIITLHNPKIATAILNRLAR